MKRRYLSIVIFMLLTLTACDSSDRDANAYYRPAVGFTAVKAESRDMVVSGLYELRMDIQDGNIALTSWDGDTVQIEETTRLTGLGSKKSLENRLDGYSTSYVSSSYEITVTSDPEKLLPFSRITTDFEIKVPKNIRTLVINAQNGSIGLSGLKDLTSANLGLQTGTIRFQDSKMYRYDLSVDRGDIETDGLEGYGHYKVSYGNTRIFGSIGDAKIRVTSGRAELLNAEGLVDCTVSKGDLDVTSSFLKAGSSLYVSKGNISADVFGLDKKGAYSFMAAVGGIKLSLPSSAGFNLDAKSERGGVSSDFTPEGANAPGGEGHAISGQVGEGGPDIKIFIDKGDVSIKSESP